MAWYLVKHRVFHLRRTSYRSGDWIQLSQDRIGDGLLWTQ